MLTNQFVRRILAWRRGESKATIVPFIQEIFNEYLAGKDHERQTIRHAVRGNPALWSFASEDDIDIYLNELWKSTEVDIIPAVRGWLTWIAITGGGNWRDTLSTVTALTEQAVLQGIDIRPHVEEIAATADCSDGHDDLYGKPSTRNLILWILGVLPGMDRNTLLQKKKAFEEQAMAEESWRCKMRRCPQCLTEFESRFDRGQCLNCGKVFHASRTT